MHGSQNLVIWSGENMFFKMISNEGLSFKDMYAWKSQSYLYVIVF